MRESSKSKRQPKETANKGRKAVWPYEHDKLQDLFLDNPCYRMSSLCLAARVFGLFRDENAGAGRYNGRIFIGPCDVDHLRRRNSSYRLGSIAGTGESALEMKNLVLQALAGRALS